MRSVLTLVRLGPRRSALVSLAWVLLGLTRLMTLALPFGAVRRLLEAGGSSAASDAESAATPSALSPRAVARARAAGACVSAASRHTPWKSECYPQALTAKLVLLAARIPHTVQFGLRRDESGQLLAHAWVSVAGTAVVGGPSEGFTVVGSFAWHP
jgi:hypothetical protein